MFTQKDSVERANGASAPLLARQDARSNQSQVTKLLRKEGFAQKEACSLDKVFASQTFKILEINERLPSFDALMEKPLHIILLLRTLSELISRQEKPRHRRRFLVGIQAGVFHAFSTYFTHFRKISLTPWLQPGATAQATLLSRFTRIFHAFFEKSH